MFSPPVASPRQTAGNGGLGSDPSGHGATSSRPHGDWGKTGFGTARVSGRGTVWCPLKWGLSLPRTFLEKSGCAGERTGRVGAPPSNLPPQRWTSSSLGSFFQDLPTIRSQTGLVTALRQHSASFPGTCSSSRVVQRPAGMVLQLLPPVLVRQVIFCLETKLRTEPLLSQGLSESGDPMKQPPLSSAQPAGVAWRQLCNHVGPRQPKCWCEQRVSLAH